jgi:hypothetical protein
MAKLTPEADETRLQEKVRIGRAKADNPEGHGSPRALRKRLKRVQRKRRSLVLRKKHAMGKKKPAEGQAPAAEKSAG